MPLPRVTLKDLKEMPREKARMFVIKDVLKLLEVATDVVNPTFGTYLHVALPEETEVPYDRPLHKVLNKIVPKEGCDLCALGCMLLAYVRRFNHMSTEQLLNNNGVISAGRHDIDDALTQLFDEDELSRIESVFEGWSSEPADIAFRARAVQAVPTGKPAADYILKAIFENMRDNGGVFKPEEAQHASRTRKSEGLRTYRYKDNPEEEAFAKAWDEQNKNYNTLAHLLADPNQYITRPPEPSKEAQVTAATVIQWLGSPVGQCFLRDLGYEKKGEK